MDGGPEKSNALEFEGKKHSTKDGSVFGEALKRSRGFMGVMREKNMQVMCDLTAGFMQYCKCMFAISHLPLITSAAGLSHYCLPQKHSIAFCELFKFMLCFVYFLYAGVFWSCSAFDLSGPPYKLAQMYKCSLSGTHIMNNLISLLTGPTYYVLMLI